MPATESTTRQLQNLFKTFIVTTPDSTRRDTPKLQYAPRNHANWQNARRAGSRCALLVRWASALSTLAS